MKIARRLLWSILTILFLAHMILSFGMQLMILNQLSTGHIETSFSPMKLLPAVTALVMSDSLQDMQQHQERKLVAGGL